MGIFDENTKTGQDFERILVEGDEEALNKLKSWLFRENIRLETERNELKKQEERFFEEKRQFQKEMDELNRRMVIERKRLKQDESFFEKKLDILKNGYAQLDAERRKLEDERVRLEAERNVSGYRKREWEIDTARMFFGGVKSQLALKKRYRDLIKMFHPDNIAGDHEMVLLINAAYDELKKEYEFGKRA